MTNFAKLLGFLPKGFRAPFYLHNSATLSALSNLGFKYDSSKTAFKPAQSGGFRIRTMSRIRPFRLKGILEVPVTGDYSYRLDNLTLDRSIGQALNDFELARSEDGVFVLNNHPGRVNLERLFQFLRGVVTKLTNRSDFVRLEDVSRLY